MTIPTNVKSRPDKATYARFLGLIFLLLAIMGLGYAGFRYFATTMMFQLGGRAQAVNVGVLTEFLRQTWISIKKVNTQYTLCRYPARCGYRSQSRPLPEGFQRLVLPEVGLLKKSCK